MKTWSKKIEDHIAHWKSNLTPSFWPSFVYHFTDVHNAVKIVKSGFLYSRNKAKELGLMDHDNASQSVIGGTPATHKDFARFYYAPRTPTQFNNEGIRPVSERGDGHCPMPVFFAFHAYDLMSMDGANYSDGNMGADRVQYGPLESDFDRVPFEMVFHRTWFNREERDEIVFHRHAELLIPEKVKLKDMLAWIGCRSVAERRTFLRLMGDDAPDSIRDVVRVADSSFYEKKWAFIDDVKFVGRQVTVHFNKCSGHVADFDFHYKFVKPDGIVWEDKKKCNCKRVFTFKLVQDFEWLDVELRMDGCLAFKDILFRAVEDMV